MREIRQSGSEGGVADNGHPYPYPIPHDSVKVNAPRILLKPLPLSFFYSMLKKHMADVSRSSRLFVTRKLPWLLASSVLVVFLATLNPWIGIQSLLPIVGASGWAFESPNTEPLHLIFGWLVSGLTRTGLSFPFLANFFTSLMAGSVLFLLARSVALLPYDRQNEERIRERSSIALLTIPLAWVPPVLATLLLSFQYLFWEHATAYTGQMLDLLLFAWCIRNLLEFRLDKKEGRLTKLALVVGLGCADNWSMLGFAPFFLVSVAWMQGVAFFRWGFLVRLFLAFFLGLSLLLLIPVFGNLTSRLDQGFWQIMVGILEEKKNQLLMFPRPRFVFLALLMIFPLAALGFRWGTPSGTGVDRLMTKLVWQLLKLVWFVACIAVAFDSRFSPRQLGYGLPLLTFSFCGSLVVGYLAGYYLLMATVKPDDRYVSQESSLGRMFFRLLAGLSVAATVAVPAVLLYRNYPVVRVENGIGLQEYVKTMLIPMRSGSSLVYCEDPLLGRALLAGDKTMGTSSGLMVVSSHLAPLLDYRRFMLKHHGNQWPGLTNVVNARENVAGIWLTVASEAARSKRLFCAAPVFSFFAELFDFIPVGSIQGALPRQSLLEKPTADADLAAVQQFWKTVEPVTQAAVRDRASGASNAFLVSSLWSRTANVSGVFYQRAGHLAEAAKAFNLAINLNPENAAAVANLLVNKSLSAGKMPGVEAWNAWDKKAGLLDVHGPVDEPEFLRLFGTGLLAQNQGLVRRAALSFDRAVHLVPTNRLYRISFIRSAFAFGDLKSATNAMAAVRSATDQGEWTPLEKSKMAEFDARIFLENNDFKSAEGHLRLALSLDPLNGSVADLLSYLYLLHGRADDALSIADQWEKAFPRSLEAISRRALIFLQTEKFKEAAEVLTRVLDQSPDNALARINRAISRLKLNQLEEARADYQRLIRDGSEDFQVCYGLAEVARLQKNGRQEVEHLERYLEIAPRQTGEFTNVVQRLAALRAAR